MAILKKIFFCDLETIEYINKTQMTTALTRPIEILLVEDNPGDVCLTLEALKDAKVRNQVTVCENGDEAIACLRRQDKYTSSPKIDLILLDLNLPGKSGREVLTEIKQDQDLKRTPVIILTSSQAEKDILQSYEMHANCYIVKPVDLDRFLAAVRSIEDFWLTVVKLPSE